MLRQGYAETLIHGDPADNAKKGDEPRGSTGVTGFALTAFCIGAKRKWIAREQVAIWKSGYIPQYRSDDRR